ncbi:MAG TPA: peptidyl-prolyl cis-trans isomerase [Methyloceanibacter sp.]|nr:peptidyl-prolyl cis-trans isomerase [Methyloceanibacter sp.]
MALDTLRKGAARTLGMILMGLLVVSFAIWGIADIFTGYGRQTLIRVGDTEISGQDYLRAQQEVLRAMSAQVGRSLSLQEARALGLDSRVMERLVGGAAVDTHARELHLGIAEAALLDEIMNDPAFKDALGNFSPAIFQQTLYSMGMNEQAYLNALRERNVRRQVLSTVGKVANSPAVLVEALNTFNGEKRTLRYALIPESVAGSIPEPTEEELKRYYENHESKFTQPEYRKIGVLAVTPETVKDQVNITEADLRAEYEASKDQLGNPERRKVQQIPFPDLGEAKAAYDKIQGGADFLDIAKERGLSEADIDLGNVTRAELADAAIADAAFKLEANKVSEPVTGKLGGVVLLRVTAIEPAKIPTFEEAKAEIEKKLLKERASGAIFDLHDKIEDQLASGAKLSETADKLKLDYVLIEEVDREGRKPDGATVTLPAQKEVLAAAFAADIGGDNDPIDAKDDGIIWYEVLGVVPQQLKPFDQVKDEVTKDWRAEEVRSRVAKYAQELVDALSSGAKTLEDVAKDLNGEVLTSDPLKRDGMTVNVLPAAVAQAFTLPEKGFGSAPSGAGEGRIVFQVDKITPPEPLTEAEATRLKQQVGLLMSEDTIAEYFKALENRYGVYVNQAALAKLIGSEEP